MTDRNSPAERVEQLRARIRYHEERYYVHDQPEISDAEFDAALADSGMSRDDLRRQMRETITLQKVIGRDVTSQMNLTDDNLRLEYERRKEAFYAVPSSARVAEIVLKFEPGDAAAHGAQAENLFGHTTPLSWHGLRGNVFCVDYSVGGRWVARLNGEDPQRRFKLAAMRWPERTLVFDDGVQAASENFGQDPGHTG